MQQFIDFVVRHWELWLTLVAILLMLAGLELRGKLTGMKNLSPQEATLLINREDAIIVDTRPTDAFLNGHIVNAINIPANELEAKLNTLGKYKDKPLIVITVQNSAPARIGAQLQTKGFANVSALSGGITAWQNAGLPLVKGK